MSISRLFNFSLTATPSPDIGVVVFTGISIVFFVLIILFIVISLQGVLFKSLGKNGKTQQATLVQAPTAVPIASQAKAPVIESGIPSEVVAAITAAIACMEGTQGLVIKSVSRVSVRRNAWSAAAAANYTEPF